jgi:hypothetical protein
VILGVGLLRGSWGRRRALKRRIADLQRENTSLLTQWRLAEAARSDRVEPTDAENRTQAQAQ